MVKQILWQPFWNDLDYTIVVDDINTFYLKRTSLQFANGLQCDDEYEIVARIISISHNEIDDVKAIHCDGLSYHIYYGDRKKISLCCEENPGDIFYGELKLINEWRFIVEVDILDEIDITSKARLSGMNRQQQKKWYEDNNKRQNELLKNYLDWK